MSSHGIMEGRIRVPGTWVNQLYEGGVYQGNANIDAGDYYLSTAAAGGVFSIFQRFSTRLDFQGAGTYSVTLDTTTRRVTISATGVANFDIVWAASSGLRDVLGFTQGDLFGASSYTADSEPRGAWFPEACPMSLGYTKHWRGWHEADLHQAESPAGHVFSLEGERKIVADLTFEAVKGCRTWIYQEENNFESFERFWLDYIYGEGPGGTPGGPVRWYADKDDLANWGTYYVVGMRELKPAFVKEGWTGRYKITFPRLVLIPDEKFQATQAQIGGGGP